MAVHLEQESVRETMTLGDGTQATVRTIAPTDGPALLRFHDHLSGRSIQMRYFYPHPQLGTDEVAHLTQVDGTDRMAFVVERDGDLIAVARYERLGDPTQAEVAFVVTDGWQHRGIASFLLQRLASRAREVGITTFCAEVLAENAPMLAVFLRAGFPTKTSREQGTVSVAMALGGMTDSLGQRGTDQVRRVPVPSLAWTSK
jgi:GNAT superfamily N-acetyltransferase